MTKVQKAILDILRNSRQHLSASEVYWRVKQQVPTVALGTVYRNLNQFADSGQIRRVGRADAADFFEGNTSPHDHAVCIHCGQMTDIVIPGLRGFLKEQIKGQIISVNLTLNYICPQCAEKSKE
ncbi:Fur family transcriptional regulator [Anaerocolumna xylanovorans]|uniref:Fur family transcriptional regulator, peroxide stress response regulator n=1 Tax=Anaerocolumna xylanovorans DSM 12503 TaxID=1121345 RepID=A0A1M7XZT2_9FIRM|nr:transcriptional repressor [Anaerocolumna xylanovorans]SHO44707.1 Fur family transcriptional regulator, peroxide stress response regulator [Anaerocolumna xylanovorans DSM 12503]